MSKFADLNRKRQKHILLNQHALYLATAALAAATERPIEWCAKEISERAMQDLGKCSDVQILDLIRNLDKGYD